MSIGTTVKTQTGFYKEPKRGAHIDTGFPTIFTP